MQLGDSLHDFAGDYADAQLDRGSSSKKTPSTSATTGLILPNPT